MHGLLRYNINVGVHARTRSGRVIQRCHNSPAGKRGYRMRVTSRAGSARRILGILKKSVRELSWVLPQEDGWLSLARRSQASGHCGAHRTRWDGGRWKTQNRKNVYLCPYVEEPLKSKVLFTNPSARAGYDTRSVFKRSLTGLNSEFSFSRTSCLTKAEEPSPSYYLPIAGGRIRGFIPFPRVFARKWT